MKNKVLIVVFFFAALVAEGQNWAPIGATWTYGYQETFFPFYGYIQWTVTKDTLVSGKNCRLIQRSGPPVIGDLSDKMITYKDSNRIFIYNTSINAFTVLYDFNKSAGESWTMQTDTCDLLITVVSTSYDTLIDVGQVKTSFITSENSAFDGKVNALYGHTTRPTPDVSYHCYGLLVDGTYYTNLRCYNDPTLGLIRLDTVRDCYDTYSIEEIATNIVNLSPNPARSYTIITAREALQDAELTLMNMAGQKIRQIKHLSGNSFTLPCDEIKSGLYILNLTQENQVIAQKKLIIVPR